MNRVYSESYERKQINEKIGNLADIVYFLPSDFEKESIHKKVLEILNNNSGLIKDNLGKLNFVELFEVIGLIDKNLLSQDIEIYKEYLKNDGGLVVNIDYGNKCSFACSHCSIEGNKNGTEIDLNDIEQYFSNFKTFDNVIKKIKFVNGGEIFERDNFDQIFRYFLEKGISDFSMISRGINEKDRGEYIEKQKIVIDKIKKLKKDFPNFSLELGISLDNFSGLNFGKIMYNILFLYDINSIFNNRHLYFSCTHNLENKEETDNLIDATVYYLNKYLLLGKSYLLFDFVSNKVIDKINNIIKLGDFIYYGCFGKRDHIFIHNKRSLKLQFDYTVINDTGRGKQQYKSNNELSFLLDKTKDFMNYREFNCSTFNNPQNVSIQKGGNIKTCDETYLKYQKGFNYDNIIGLTEEEFINTIAKKQSNLYKNIKINNIVKLIDSKRKGNFICMNNMLSESK